MMALLTKIGLSLCGILIVISLIKCKSQKTPDDVSDFQLYFGSGGGFTGLVKEYCLLQDGWIYTKDDIDKNWEKVVRLPKNQTRQHFDLVKKLDLFNLKFSEPGNMYFYLKVKDGSQENRMTWHSHGTQPDSSIVKLYRILNETVKEAYKKAHSNK